MLPHLASHRLRHRCGVSELPQHQVQRDNCEHLKAANLENQRLIAKHPSRNRARSFLPSTPESFLRCDELEVLLEKAATENQRLLAENISTELKHENLKQIATTSWQRCKAAEREAEEVLWETSADLEQRVQFLEEARGIIADLEELAAQKAVLAKEAAVQRLVTSDVENKKYVQAMALDSVDHLAEVSELTNRRFCLCFYRVEALAMQDEDEQLKAQFTAGLAKLKDLVKCQEEPVDIIGTTVLSQWQFKSRNACQIAISFISALSSLKKLSTFLASYWQNTGSCKRPSILSHVVYRPAETCWFSDAQSFWRSTRHMLRSKRSIEVQFDHVSVDWQFAQLDTKLLRLCELEWELSGAVLHAQDLGNELMLAAMQWHSFEGDSTVQPQLQPSFFESFLGDRSTPRSGTPKLPEKTLTSCSQPDRRLSGSTGVPDTESDLESESESNPALNFANAQDSSLECQNGHRKAFLNRAAEADWYVDQACGCLASRLEVASPEQVQAARADGVDYAPDGKDSPGALWADAQEFRPPRVQIVQMLKDEIGRRDEEVCQTDWPSDYDRCNSCEGVPPIVQSAESYTLSQEASPPDRQNASALVQEYREQKDEATRKSWLRKLSKAQKELLKAGFSSCYSVTHYTSQWMRIHDATAPTPAQVITSMLPEH
ncbi:unnamed protein product [Symbiodinium sp. CCMP2592]|nr:unnamed protein product [Symbiodinium sp. CCMP2592]